MNVTFAQLEEIYHRPFFDLIQESRRIHEKHWPGQNVQLCTLLSIKTGACSEDCGYCSQSAHHHTGLKPEPLMTTDEVMPHARAAKENGSTRFCMGAAWKGVRSGDRRFESVLETVREVSKLGMEVCVTLGQLSDDEAKRLKEAGVTAYNHNIDTSPEYYPSIVSTHTFEDRLNTIGAVQRAGMSVCCGGILGLGESVTDRLRMLEVLANFDPAPESVPINCLVAVEGTPLEDAAPVKIFELVRLIATARMVLPHSKIRLSAGRTSMTQEGQALCLFAGANSFFYGDTLLTTPNPETNEDMDLLSALNLRPLEPHSPASVPVA
ncbi:MAG: biotin synthase BioB [Chthoniobacterales bacterium]